MNLKKENNKERKKRVAIIGTVGVPANYGGFETLAEHLIEKLSGLYSLTVYCSGKTYAKDIRKKNYKGAKLNYIPLEANGIQSILYDTISILHAAFYSDVLLVLGVAGAWILPFVRLFTNKKIIVSIDGIEWKRDKWNILAKWYLFWAESIAVKYSHIDISDNEAIQNYTAMRYKTLSRIIEYGADHTLKVEITQESKIRYPFLQKDYAFKVCRIEPENNIHIILKAFADPKVGLPIVIIGNWNKSVYGKELRNKYSGIGNIIMLDPIYNQEELDLIRSNSKLYIHGHSAGGTNPSLVEAMYLGLPILAFDVSYNRVTTENKALYFKDIQELLSILENWSLLGLSELAISMRKIAERRYVWEKICNKYGLLIEEALQTKKKLNVEPRIKQLSHSKLLKISAAHLKVSNNF